MVEAVAPPGRHQRQAGLERLNPGRIRGAAAAVVAGFQQAGAAAVPGVAQGEQVPFLDP